jgi:hypothetical protein
MRLWYLERVRDIAILIKILAAPRPDGQQRVVYLPFRGRHFTLSMLSTIKEVK